jgi:hypothetical protein
LPPPVLHPWSPGWRDRSRRRRRRPSGTESPPTKAVATGISTPETASTAGSSSSVRPGRSSAAPAMAARRPGHQPEQITIAKCVLIGQSAGGWERTPQSRADPCQRSRGPNRHGRGHRLAIQHGRGDRPSPARGGQRDRPSHNPRQPALGRHPAGRHRWPEDCQALQRKVGARVDGVIGAGTVRLLQAKIGACRDGAGPLNAGTVSALQKFLTAR